MAARQKRAWQPRELQMVSEFIAMMYPRDWFEMRVRLGTPKPAAPTSLLTDAEKRMVGVWRRWADAIVYRKHELILIEAAIRPDPGDISRLQLYFMLVPMTPELKPHWNKKIILELVYAIEDPATITLARRQGIRCIEYKPPWLEGYLEILMPRERIGHRT